MRTLTFLLILATALPVRAQFGYPSSASTMINMAQLADGGPADQKWTTTVIFTNPSLTQAASVAVFFYDNSGSPLALDFGAGAFTSLSLTVPAGGSISRTSTGASTSMKSGWGRVLADAPVTGSILYQARNSVGPYWDVAAVGTGSTFFYSSYANGELAVALANPNPQAIHLHIVARTDTGTQTYTATQDLPPMGHTSFNLLGPPTNIPRTFTGSITITSSDLPLLPFVAWTLNVRDNLLAPLPPGETQNPGPRDRRPYDIAFMIKQAGIALLPDLPSDILYGRDKTQIAGIVARMNLVVDQVSTYRAYYNRSDDTIHLTIGLVEALGASDGALAFIIGHVACHGVFLYTSTPPPGSGLPDPEHYADAMALLAMLKGGFDPGGALDFLARIHGASVAGAAVDPALLTEFGLPLGLAARMQDAVDNVQDACDMTTTMDQMCSRGYGYWFPHSVSVNP